MSVNHNLDLMMMMMMMIMMIMIISTIMIVMMIKTTFLNSDQDLHSCSC